MTIPVTLTSRTYDPALGQFITTYTEVTATFQAAVATQSALPPSGNTLYDARITLDDNHLHCWNGSAWIDVGGSDVYDYVVNESIPGTVGTPALTFKESVANQAALPLIGNSLNDTRITNDTGHLYIWNGTTWVDQGDIIDFQWSAIEDKPSSSVADIDSAVSLKHTQGTDQGLDTGGANAVTAAQAKAGYSHSQVAHAPSNAVSLATVKADTDIDNVIDNTHAPHSDDQVIPDQLSDLSDDTTHRLVTDVEKSTWNGITDVALNVMLNAFRIAQIGSLTIFSMVKGFMDEYEDESGIDLGNSVNQNYNNISDFYTNVDFYTKLLLHLDNNVTDSEIIPKTVTNNGVTFSSSEKKFGTYSALFNGSATLTVPDSDDFAFDSGDFTIETWVRLNSIGPGIGICDQMQDGENFWSLALNLAGMTDIWFSTQVSGAVTVEIKASYTWLVDTWYHIALVRSGTGTNCFNFYVNGVALSTTLNNGSWAGSVHSGSGNLKIGQYIGTGYYLNGYLDEFRISNNARWTSDFTPSSSEYSISGNMILQSNAQVATIVPVESRVILFEEDVDSVTLNTDLKAYVSRDNGTTFSQVTLEDEGNYITGARILSGVVDISAQPSGSNMKYKIETLNTKKLNIHGTAVSWK
jgi:hypothetical protein